MVDRQPRTLSDDFHLDTIQSNGSARRESGARRKPSELQSIGRLPSRMDPKHANDPGWFFRKDCLDRKLRRQHITGLFYAAVE